MDNNYKLIISNRNFYREAVLDGAQGKVTLGTATGMDIRLHKDLFFEHIGLEFTYTTSGWDMITGENLYISAGATDIRKLRTVSLRHGDRYEIHYQESENLAFILEYVINFDEGKHEFNRYADCTSLGNIIIGSGSNCHIELQGPYVERDCLELIRNSQGFIMRIIGTTYGIMHNGRKTEDGEQFRNGDFFSIADNFFYLRNDHLWTDRSNQIVFHGIPVYDTVNRGSYPRFRRSSRVKVVVNEDKIPVLDPAQKPQKPKNNLLLRLLPSCGMLIAAGLMVAISHSWTMIVFSGCSVIIGIITAILTLKNNNKDYNESLEERINTYNAYIANKRMEIEQCRSDERQTLEELYIPQEQESTYVHQFSPALFDRSRDDDDFMCVRLGTGTMPSLRGIDYKKQEKLEPGDELQQIPELLQKEYANISDVPVVVDFKEINAIGIIGQEAYRLDLMKNMVIDLACRQFSSDVKMAFIAREEHKDRVNWLRFLPNVMNEQTGVRNIVVNDESKTVIFEYLYKELTWREQAGGFDSNMVVFLYDEYGFRNHPVSYFVSRAKELGVAFVFFGDQLADIPQGCDQLVYLNNRGAGCLLSTADKSQQHMFSYPVFSDAQVLRLVELLAPICIEEISLEGDLTRNISLYQLMGILSADDLNLTKRWAASNVIRSMAAPLGVTKTGEISLDLHDKAHGPHGLVAGTTGSGKSEILQTYILSMATLFHPYEVGFMIIDFKGGGMAGQFEHLPHLIGTITNIDGKEINRSLKSIKAELQKRQRLFAEADVNHIDKYIQKYKAGAAQVPLPHLIIIVDEFAELKAEQPDFMKELISAARIGRSLGVHLILATQKPAGQVNEQIWSNSRFKLCLKVQSKEDSNEVLKSPLAAEIKEPGRAYLQVGNNEIFELLQSAYSGAPAKTDDSSVREFSLIELTDTAKRVPVYVQKKSGSGDSLTQLDAIVQYVDTYCTRNGISRLPQICLPSLKEVIDFPPEEALSAKNYAVTTELGIYDDPDNQYQGTYTADLANENVMIIGSSQSGKTNVLQTMIRSIAMKYSPEEVTIYIIDFASMILKNFESLNHVGGVVTSSEDEKLKNLFKLLRAEMNVRKEKMLSVGVSSFVAYKEAGRTDMPQIVVMIDNITALKEMYFQDDDELVSLCREGLSVGITVVIANAQTTGIGYRYLSNFPTRIALFCNDSGEYSTLFDHCRITPDDICGRAIVDVDKTLLECQMFLAFEGEKEIDRVRSVKSFIEERNGAYAGSAAQTIPEIPELLTAADVKENYGRLMQPESSIVAGLDYETVTPVVFNLAKLGVLTLCGRPGMGQNNFVHYLVQIQEQMHSGKSEVYIADGLGKRLKDISGLGQVKAYEYLPDRALTMVQQVEEKLVERYEQLLGGNEDVVDNSAILMLIINSPDVLKSISSDKDSLARFQNITGKYKNMGVCVIYGSYENAQVAYGAPELIKNAKDSRHFMVFEDLANFKVFDMPLTITRNFKKPIEAGDAYYIKDNDCLKLKTPLWEN